MRQHQIPDFLAFMIFKFNGFGTTDQLIAAIQEAEAVSAATNWHARQAAFNRLHDLAPIRASSESGFLVMHPQFPKLVQHWMHSASMLEAGDLPFNETVPGVPVCLATQAVAA